MNRYFFLFFLLITTSVNGQLLTDSLYSAETLIADLDSLEVVLMRTHTDPFRYTNEFAWKNNMHHARSQCAEGLNYIEFSKVVATLLRTLQDSHTYLSFGHLNGQIPMGEYSQLGIKLGRDTAGIFVTHDRFDICQPGDYLLKINGHNLDSAWTEAAKLSMQEARSPSARSEVSTVLLGNFLPMLLPIRKDNDFEIIRNGNAMTLQHPAVKKSSLKKLGWKPLQPLLNFYVEDETLAVMRIGSFSKGSGRKFKRFVDRSFRHIEKQEIAHLVLDIRRNGGGKSSRMEYVMRHVLKDSVAIPNSIVYRQSDIGYSILGKNDKWWRRPFMKFASRKNTALRNYLDMLATPMGESDTLNYVKQGPYTKHAFEGKCYLLTNGLSGSASVNLASVFRQHDRGLIVGRPCLGPMSGTWGNPGVYKLGNSGLTVLISTIRFNISDDQDAVDEIQPDVLVPSSAQDAASGIDAEVEAVLRLIGN